MEPASTVLATSGGTARSGSSPTPETIGILGAGRVGTALARQALKAGYAVKIATAKPPEEIALIAQFTAPGAKAVTAEEAAQSDIVVLAMPLFRHTQVPPAHLSGRVVVDVMNYWAPTDGHIPDFEGEASSSEVVQRHLNDARLVRTLNHIGYHDLEDQAFPAGHPDRQAAALASDDADAKAKVAEFIDRLGYDPVDAGPLTAARKFGAGTPVFGNRLKRDELKAILAA
ncbi:MAG: NAD(P)-binding domain-containing protein [Devosia sp.]